MIAKVRSNVTGFMTAEYRKAGKWLELRDIAVWREREMASIGGYR
jgi:hypothetical protein